MKKITSLLLCLVMLLTLTAPVHAAEEGGGEGGTPSEATEHIHSWGDGAVTTPATCTAEGVMTYTCACNETKTTAIEKTSHNWSEWETITAAGCTNDGEKKRTCSTCSTAETETVSKLNHSFGEWTKNADGHSRSCTRSECLVEDSGSHSFEDRIIEEATCAKEGKKTRRCTVCGYETAEETIPKSKTHTYTNKCDEKCSVCNSKNPKIEHTYDHKCDTECNVCNSGKRDPVHTYDNACDPECNVCKSERETEHKFTKVWSHDSKTHWYECTKCEEKKDEGKHIYGPAATEDYPQVCLTCDRVIVPKKEHVHSYGAEWSSDEVGHWHACATCEVEKDYSGHRYDNDCDEECNDCGYKREDVHKYDEDAWQTTNFEHWNVCTLCAEESRHEKHVPGEEATELAPQLCTVCGFELAPILDHDHRFGNKWYQDEQNHWQECDCGELSVPEAHVWNEGIKNRNDTITFTCKICGSEKTEQAPSSGISWVLVFLIVLALICLAGIVVLVILLKKGTFNDGDSDDHDFDDPDFGIGNSGKAAAAAASSANDEFTDIDFELPQKGGQDDEEQMIDDFFASLGDDLYK